MEEHINRKKFREYTLLSSDIEWPLLNPNLEIYLATIVYHYKDLLSDNIDQGI